MLLSEFERHNCERKTVIPFVYIRMCVCVFLRSHGSDVPYLHGESSSLLVVVVQDVGHEGGVVGQPLTHAQGDGLTGEQTVAPGHSIHGDGDTHGQHGHGKHPQEIHDPYGRKEARPRR